MVAFDVVEDILLRSDAKDLLRCKSVCKSWYSLISTSRFVKAHLKIAAANDNHSRIAMPTLWKRVKLPHTILYQHNLWSVVGSSNGLVCVSRNDGITLVINPCTREVRTLPIAPISPVLPVWGLGFSFGYDASSHDYKVVMGFLENENPHETLFQVLSLKSNTWKTIGRFNYSLVLEKSGIMFNGSIYWIVFDHKVNPPKGFIHYIILSFDLSRESFSIIPQPKDSRYLMYPKLLGVMKNQLCLYFPGFPQEIWVMRSHDAEHSWERLPNDCEMMTHHAVHFMNMLEFSSSDKNQERINFVCLDNKCLPKPWKEYSHIFFPSLISPFVNSDERPSHPTDSKTTFVNKWSIQVAKGEGPKYIKASEKIAEDYRKEVGEAQNLYLHKDGAKMARKASKKIAEDYRKEVGEAQNLYLHEDGVKMARKASKKEDYIYIKKAVRVEYEWKPPHCPHCKSFGHDTHLCPKRVREEVSKNSTKDNMTTTMEENDDGFTKVYSRKKKGEIRLNKPKSKVMWQQNKGVDAKSNFASTGGNGNVVSNPDLNTSNHYI